MAEVIREVGYTGFVQRLTWAHGNAVDVIAYLYGGGGGGGARAPTGSFTTSYQGDIQQNPFTGLLYPNKSGYYILCYSQTSEIGTEEFQLAWVVVINGIVVYGSAVLPVPPTPTAGLNGPPPTTLANPTTFRGVAPDTAPYYAKVYDFDYTTYTSGAAIGGAGGGGAYAQVNFTINEGDILDIAVGQGGGAGGVTALASGITPGGEAGAGLLTSSLFNTVTNPASPPVYRRFNPTYSTFLNNYGVWVDPPSTSVFDRTYTVTFPSTGNYQFTICSNGRADFYVDGDFVAFSYDPQIPWTVGFSVTAGARTVRIISTAATGKAGAVALVIGSGVNYAGARGGDGIAGGGGAGGVGQSANPGNGGVGLSSSISGTSTYYAGGGAGGGNNSFGTGGLGGGGGTNTANQNGTLNTGGGGGSSGVGTGAGPGGNGGSGIVIIRYADTYPAATSTTGVAAGFPVVSGGYRIYKWITSGSITF